MTTPPDHDEMRIRGQLRERIDGAPVPPPRRQRDWLDDLWDTDDTKPPAAERAPEPVEQQPAGEPRWDWTRLRRWPLARPVCGACLALLPFLQGQSLATSWGGILTQARTEAGVGAAWVIAAVGLAIGAMWVHNRRSWIAWTLLTSAFVGTVAMANPSDIVTFITGASQ
ncbi:hypothetical protein [Actinacidiphila rubida]|uniref:Uncharacterized protein n=1 Tax=Actinacidiphila rubida TaxID=310780 RepID=A0A1H8SZW0_9ACTN|nr:hypothetical protein [Actinacidiphila rubida]SEO83878.1 hypothetical protein SAMN05216267_104671 [Actinacidiphila rubida]